MLFLLVSTVNAEVSSTIDRNPVRVNETFELTLHMETAPVSRPPLKGLPDVFEIVRSTNFYQRSTINGKSEVQAGWRFILRATEEGIFTIPEFEVDGKKTKVLQLKVLPPVSSTNIGDQQDAIRLTATVDYEDVYVQQQVLYTIRLYRAVQAQYASLTEPQLDGAILERLGEDRQYETEEEGVRYIVLERRYVIFPQEKGIQTISPVTFTAEVSDGARQYSTLGRLRSRTTAVSLSTEEIDIKVKGRPEGIVDWWLPANNVTLSEQWLPDPVEFRVGEPVTWQYSIKANGLTATQLPELLPDAIDGLKFYPDTAESTNNTDENGITGERKQKVAVVPTKAGTLTLPELKLSWWNVKENKAYEITLDARTIQVLPSVDGETGEQPSEQITIPESSSSITEAEPEVSEPAVEQTENISESPDVTLWKMIAIISLLLWVISALILTLRNKQSSIPVAKTPSQPYQTNTTIDDIKRACKRNSASATKDAILKWCLCRKGLKSVHSLTELAKRVGNEELTEQLKLLEHHLYSSNKKDWNGKGLASVLKAMDAYSVNTVANNSKDGLPPLHLTTTSHTTFNQGTS